MDNSYLHAYGTECITVLNNLLHRFEANASNIAVYLIYDRPSRQNKFSDLNKTYFVERCLSDQQLNAIVSALRSTGCYVKLFNSEIEFIAALSSGSLDRINNKRKSIVYNGIEGGIGQGNSFSPGRKSLIPAICDAYGMNCANSNAYGCSIGRHKYHYITLLRACGLPAPKMWFYELGRGWLLGDAPPLGEKVIVKSTYESWSVGVTRQSVFIIGKQSDERIAAIAHDIGQSVCVQKFESGDELCVPVFSCPKFIAPPIVQAIVTRQPNDPNAIMTIDDNLTEKGVQYSDYQKTGSKQLEIAAKLAVQCCIVMSLEGLARIDMRIKPSGQVHIFDIGVSPGITEKGSSASAFMSLGYSYEEFIQLVFAGNFSLKNEI